MVILAVTSVVGIDVIVMRSLSLEVVIMAIESTKCKEYSCVMRGKLKRVIGMEGIRTSELLMSAVVLQFHCVNPFT